MCSQELCELGVVSGADLTVEAALTKLSYLLGRPDLDVEAVREVGICMQNQKKTAIVLQILQSMARSLCGELTCTESEHNIVDVSSKTATKDLVTQIHTLGGE